MKFTYAGEYANRKIQDYLEIIKEEIIKNVPDVKSIIVGGGFGRGEGSVEVVGKRVIPINDFDLFIITKKEIEETILNEAANNAIKKLGIKNAGLEFYEFDREKYSNTFYVDLKNLTIKKLKKLLPPVRYYELRNASTVISRKDYWDLMPDYKLEDLHLTGASVF